MTFYYKIAGLTVAMDSFGRIVEQAKPYLVKNTENADIRISSDWQSLKASQPHLTDEECEYLVTGGSFYSQLLDFDGMMLHSSAVVVDGKAYLFSASCGTGKSTHTKLWLQVLGEQARILNDDKPALRYEDGEFFAYGTPWSGKTAQNVNLRVPLGGICVLRRGEENKIEPYRGTCALHDILEQTIRPRSPKQMVRLLDLMDKLMLKVPVWKMECNMAAEAAIMSYEAMSGKEYMEGE